MVQRIQISLGLWRPTTRKARRVFPLRPWRPRFGELIQDDTTGRLTALQFAPVKPGSAYLA
jgi:hypothetical protein